MAKYLLVIADTNDADYVERLAPISDEQLDLVMPLIEAIGAFQPYTIDRDGRPWTHRHNFPTGDILRTDLGEKGPDELYPGHEEALEFLEWNHLPHSEYGIHTIEDIKVLDVSSERSLLQ